MNDLPSGWPGRRAPLRLVNMSLPQIILVGIVLLGALVFVHELGHFLAAKFFGVKVTKFSLGFGPKLWSFQRGETEYQIAALPLGGFVKMAGDDPTADTAPEDQGRGFLEQAPYKRAIIALAGPAVNLLLPPLVFFAVFLTPQPEPPPVVGIVLPGEPAEMAGLQPGDRILSVDGIPSRSFDEMRELVEARGGQRIELEVDRLGERMTLSLTSLDETETNPIETTRKGRIGIVAGKLPSYVAVAHGSRAELAGVQTFDRVVEVNGEKVRTTVELRRALQGVGGEALELKVLRSVPLEQKTASGGTAQTIAITVPPGEAPLGFGPADLHLREVEESSAAWAAGLRPGDRIVALDGTPVASRLRLGKLLEERRGELVFGVERAGERLDIAFTPEMVERRDPALGKVKVPDYGFAFESRVFASEPFTPEELVMVSYSPGEAFSRAIDQTVAVTRIIVLGIAGLFSGKISHESIGGPIMIFQLAGSAAEHGLLEFLKLFAIISINLGLVNLLPVPILDGFHIVVSGIEGISRRPVSLRFREVANYVGLAMLLSLMVLAFKNDIVRTFAQ